jgi:hypothetical protein
MRKKDTPPDLAAWCGNKMQTKLVRSRGGVVSALFVGALGLSFGADPVGAAVTIDTLSTQVVFGPGTTANDVDGKGLDDEFEVGNEYDINYSGDYTKVTGVNTSLGSFIPTASADYLFRRSSTPNNDIVYFRTTNATGSTLNLSGLPVGEQGDAFAGNTISLGVDNVFANIADANGNVTNVERVDLVFKNGVNVTGTKGFAVIERGNLNQHDSFGIAAITAIDSEGNPTAYGTLTKFAVGNWGNSALLDKNKEYVVMRKDNDAPSDEFGPSALVNNNLGGVFIPLTDLASVRQTIFGFSIVGGDVSASGSDLVDWTNGAFFPKNTVGHLSSAGGLDPTGTLAILYDVAVPEPASAGLFALLAVTGLTRRRTRHA